MGLTNDFSKFGVTFEGAYHKVSTLNYTVTEALTPVVVVEGSFDENDLPIPPVYENQWVKRAYGQGEVETYTSEAARTAHSESLARTSFSFNYDLESTDSWIEQAYTHIKTLPAFTGATDVL